MRDNDDTLGDLNYLVAMSERAFFFEDGAPTGLPQTNMRYEARRVPIQNGRPIASAVSLDRQGFAFCNHPTVVRDFRDEETLHHVYYPESEEFIARITGATRVVTFDHTLRRRMPDAYDRHETFRLPAMRVHVDFTPASARQRVRDVLPLEADQLLSGRIEFINLWRPIRAPVLDAPVAVCDARSVNESDFVSADLIYRARKGEIFYATFNPSHRWYYFPRMQTDEVLLLKNFDSETDRRARCALHSAFLDPAAPDDAAPRESIELRTIAFHGGQ